MADDGFNWIVLVGGYSGDGSADHRLFGNADGDRMPMFRSREAAEDFVARSRAGEHAVIAEVFATTSPATAVEYIRSGRRVVITEHGDREIGERKSNER